MCEISLTSHNLVCKETFPRGSYIQPWYINNTLRVYFRKEIIPSHNRVENIRQLVYKLVDSDAGLRLKYIKIIVFHCQVFHYTFTIKFQVLTTLSKNPFENIAGKRENAGNQHFLLLLQMFSTL